VLVLIRSFAVLAMLVVMLLVLVACGSSGTGEKRVANSLSGGDAATEVKGELANRTFTDEFGRVHECSEYITTLVMSSWEPDTESWMITFSGGYESGTRIFRFFETGSAFEHVAGPPLPASCGV
jgi:hypothetical protein